MLPKLTFNDGQYVVPHQWRDWDWINDIDNYPDPHHHVFKEEYDWEFKEGQNVLARYIRSISGHSYTRKSKKGNKFEVTKLGQPVIYYKFALGAVELINNPFLYREAHRNSINGQFVVNYSNSIETGLDNFPSQARKKHLIPSGYGALLARVFNATSGVRMDDYLKVESREPKKCFCPNCKSVFTQVTRDVLRPGDEGYEDALTQMGMQIEYRITRDVNG
jgi:hypothetical protein